MKRRIVPRRPASPSEGLPRIVAASGMQGRTVDMWVILLEALGALALLLLIVWWTMFHGRHKGERRPPDEAP